MPARRAGGDLRACRACSAPVPPKLVAKADTFAQPLVPEERPAYTRFLTTGR